MKIIVDANVVLRYLLDDNKEMADRAEEVIQKGVFLLPEVLAEVVYVLKSVYNMERMEVATCLLEFLDIVNATEKDVLKEALNLYKKYSLDFVDCLLIAYNKTGNYEIFSFDRKLNKVMKNHI